MTKNAFVSSSELSAHFTEICGQFGQIRISGAARAATVTETVRKWSAYDLPDTLEEMIAELQAERDEIPAEYRAKARFDCDLYSEWDCPIADISITYERKKTKEEKARDTALIAAEEEAAAKAMQERERAEFERLKAKFG